MTPAAQLREELLDAKLALERAAERLKEAQANVHLHPKHLEAFAAERQEAAEEVVRLGRLVTQKKTRGKGTRQPRGRKAEVGQ
jgi:hypothetical protein